MDIVSHIGETKKGGGDALKPQPKIHTKYITPRLLFNENIKKWTLGSHVMCKAKLSATLEPNS